MACAGYFYMAVRCPCGHGRLRASVYLSASFPDPAFEKKMLCDCVMCEREKMRAKHIVSPFRSRRIRVSQHLKRVCDQTSDARPKTMARDAKNSLVCAPQSTHTRRVYTPLTRREMNCRICRAVRSATCDIPPSRLCVTIKHLDIQFMECHTEHSSLLAPCSLTNITARDTGARGGSVRS